MSKNNSPTFAVAKDGAFCFSRDNRADVAFDGDPPDLTAVLWSSADI